ncbi:MAG: phosphoserine phosphatase SerB [Paracoccaceae bacterium]|nr:phosphoserine phosphatase SerB [Paracoccaceae bacterium]MDG1970804.1 phosphoserine phosphatase SerB [Paracoccaceae bacterium]
MTHVLVLTSAGPLGAGEIKLAQVALAAAATKAQATRRLADKAAEISFVGDVDAVLPAVRTALGSAPIDANVVPAENRQKRLLISDMDSTIIPVECIDEIADFAGVKDRVSAITERAMQGELDFDGALRERVGLLKGLSVEALERTYVERISLNPGAGQLVAEMKQAGALTSLVSGGFTYFTERVAAAVGFDRHQANTLLIESDVLTGGVAEPILGREAKLIALQDLTAEIDATPNDAVAVGDGANDLAMIEAAGLGIAYRAKPAVAAKADARLDHSDLSAILRLQGIAELGR